MTEYTKVCPQCGATFTTTKKLLRYCSRKCDTAHRMARQAGYTRRSRTISCIRCGTRFRSHATHLPDKCPRCRKHEDDGIDKEGHLEPTDEERREWGLSTRKELSGIRTCLRCDRKFMSWGPDNRICYSCQRHEPECHSSDDFSGGRPSPYAP
jgi:phage FluMu protein Com